MGDRKTVRAWTCELTNRFTVEDPVLAMNFMGVPFLRIKTYCQNFLEFAFAEMAGAR